MMVGIKVVAFQWHMSLKEARWKLSNKKNDLSELKLINMYPNI